MGIYEGLSEGEIKDLLLKSEPSAIIDVMGVFDDFVTDNTWLDEYFDKENSYFIILDNCAKSFNSIYDIVKDMII